MAKAQVQTQLPLDDSDLPALIVLGRDDTNKAHASWFDGTETERAAQAAALMGMMTIAVANDDVRTLATRLPHGRIFGSGKAFVPFVKGTLFEELMVHVPLAAQLKPLRLVKMGDDAPAEPASSPSTGPVKIERFIPSDWAKIGPGAVVLATSDASDEGWFEAVVVAARPNDVFTLAWRDYPGEPNLVRHRNHLGLLHSTAGLGT